MLLATAPLGAVSTVLVSGKASRETAQTKEPVMSTTRISPDSAQLRATAAIVGAAADQAVAGYLAAEQAAAVADIALEAAIAAGDNDGAAAAEAAGCVASIARHGANRYGVAAHAWIIAHADVAPRAGQGDTFEASSYGAFGDACCIAAAEGQEAESCIALLAARAACRVAESAYEDAQNAVADARESAAGRQAAAEDALRRAQHAFNVVLEVSNLGASGHAGGAVAGPPTAPDLSGCAPSSR